MKIDQPTPPKPRRKAWLRCIGWLVMILPLYVFILEPVWNYLFDSEIIISKETTYLTEPFILADSLDYVVALNNIQSDGVTPESNGAVLLAKAIGPNALGKNNVKSFYDQLGIGPLPRKGSYLISRYEFAGQHFANDSEMFIKFEKQQEVAQARPWSSEEFPYLAAWVKQNHESLQLVSKASIKPHFFVPIISGEDLSQGALSSERRTLQQCCYEFRDLLLIRAMQQNQKGNIEGVLSDLLTLRRLGRLLQKGSSSTDYLSGVGHEHASFEVEVSLLNAKELSPTQLKYYLNHLQEIGSPALPAELFNVKERLYVLDTCLHWLNIFMINKEGKRGDVLSGNVWFDVNSLLKSINHHFDQLEKRMSLPKYVDRKDAVESYEKKVVEEMSGLNSHGLKYYGSYLTRKGRTKTLGRGVDLLWLHKCSPLLEAEARGIARYRLVNVALLLEKHHLKNQSYPATLIELQAEMGSETFTDPFSDQFFIYKRTKTGYLLYSVGGNLKEDGGRESNSEPPADDIKIQIGKPE